MFSAAKSQIVRAWGWYERYERPISSISLVAGFIFDAIALKRVDMFWENFWVAAHLLVVAACIILIHRDKTEEIDIRNPARLHFWLINTLQFFFGGLLSTYLVFYFRSGSLAVSWPFLLVLAGAFVANESLKKRFSWLTFQVGLFYLSLYLFAIFIVPVVLHSIGWFIFLFSGVVSLAVMGLFLLILRRAAKEKYVQGERPFMAMIVGICIGVNGLYFLNLIPPIPLSLKDASVYHTLVPNGPGNYTVSYEDAGKLGWLQFVETVHLAPGNALYAYSAVFSPTALNTNIIHEWEWYDTTVGSWVVRDRVPLSVIGGSDGGYRTYSMKESLDPGAWRINIETPGREVIGRLRFNVVAVQAEPTLVTSTIGAAQ